MVGMENQTLETGGSQIVVRGSCRCCHKTQTVVAPKEGWDAWKAGSHIQDVMPDVPRGERELLISGVCGLCFDEMFADEEGDYDGTENYN